MNAERLLAHFEQISEAPDAVARLRRFILDLAVRGKLVEQDPEDEPAEELLASVALEKFRRKSRESRIAGGLLPRDRNYVQPFSLHAGWQWTTLEDYALDVSTGPFGSMLHQSDYIVGGIPVINPSHMVGGRIYADAKVSVSPGMAEQLESYKLAAGDIVMARRGEVGRAALVTEAEQGWLCGTGSFIVRFIPEALREYVLLFLSSDLARGYLTSNAIGTTMTNLNHGILKKAPIPLPPLAEQHRIVAKVDELMALCDQLEAARQEREQTRERLVAASLQRLNEPAEDAASFRQHATFALQTLPFLTTTTAQIKQLRQCILNLAVRGKLVEQDSEDEPAVTWLLQRLKDSSPGRTRKPRVKVIEEGNDEVIALLPESWLWVVLDDLIESMDSGWSPQCEDHPRSSMECWGVLKTTAVQSLSFDDRHHKELPSKLQPRPQYEARQCDILVTRAGPKNRVGISCVVGQVEPRLMISDKIIRFRVADEINPRFVALALNTGRSGEAVEQAKTGMAVMQMNISQVKLRAVPIPLPPLAEQHRIVAKVDELMALCDQLEQQLSQAEQQRRRLLETVLAEALAEREPVLEELVRT